MRNWIGIVAVCVLVGILSGATGGLVVRFAPPMNSSRTSDSPEETAQDPLPESPTPYDETWAVESKSASDMQAARTALGDAPEPDRMAGLLDESSGWLPIEGEEARFEAVRDGWLVELRRLVVEHVQSFQNSALQAPDGAAALAMHARASRLLALYPISQEDAVLDEAQSLAAAQSELLRRIELIRRQRYNVWTVDQIAAAVEAYHSSNLSVEAMGRSDDGQVVEATVAHLAEIDPAMLEPAVLGLYNYVIDLVNADVSQSWRIEFARRLTGSEVSRKTLEGF
ncbi:MAG: hypothetical protein C4547_11440 [Phycisphaerales bacterium]|nr:MAG: hypothetical protein C4547_11440 [Phycisphaerales bacterium]